MTTLDIGGTACTVGKVRQRCAMKATKHGNTQPEYNSSRIRSQWSLRSRGLMCCDFPVEKVSRAAELRTDCNLSRRYAETPARTALHQSTLLTTSEPTKVSKT